MATKTQIYKEVLREYDALRTRKAAELRERKESLYARFPRLAEIEETLSMVGVSTAKLVLLHPEEREKAMTEMKQKQQVLQDERMALLAKNLYNSFEGVVPISFPKISKNSKVGVWIG